jgi:mutator protein MutT
MMDQNRAERPAWLHATVCFIRREQKILLQERPAGRRWAGILNGPGGKIEKGETPLQAVEREIAEETSLQLAGVTAHGMLRLTFESEPVHNLAVHVFSASEFIGTPHGAEGTLDWFAEDRLPFERMWPDQRYWLPLVLAGGRVEAVCSFDASGASLLSCQLQLSLP